jgi:type II secretory ATPase GspE/PulE/Tfp pilus assembly ATPase PilB-like protein
MARSPLWDLLNSKVTLSGLVADAGGKPAADRDVEEILERAAAEASRRGRSVEEVLAEFGFNVAPGATRTRLDASPQPSPPQTPQRGAPQGPPSYPQYPQQPPQYAQQPNPAQYGQAPQYAQQPPQFAPQPPQYAQQPAYPPQAEAPQQAMYPQQPPQPAYEGPTANPPRDPRFHQMLQGGQNPAQQQQQPPSGRAAPPTKVPDAVVRALAPMEPAEATVLLARFTPEFHVIERLELLGLVDGPRASPLREAQSAPALLASALAIGVSADSLALIARTLPGAPPASPTGADFTEFLLTEAVMRYPELRAAQNEAATNELTLLAQIEKGELVGPAVLASAIAKFSGLDRGKVPARATSKAAVDALASGWVRAFRMVPLRADAKGVVVASSNAPPDELVAALTRSAGKPVSVQIVTAQELNALRDAHLARVPPPAVTSASATSIGAPGPLPRGSAIAPSPNLDAHGTYAPTPATTTNAFVGQSLRTVQQGISAVVFVKQLFEIAIEARATDVHLEPGANDMRVRFRIDGICHDLQRVPTGLAGEIVARIKVLSELDITERRQPQDGHVPIEISGHSYDLRVATVPSRYGEKVAVRIADCGRTITRLQQIGLAPEMLATLRELASKPFGMVLATGPVGSGKTTTLYACLGEVDRTRRHVMTIEDPIEIELDGASQVEVNYAINFDFVNGLRAILRQDPDVVLLGEVRDEETARIAVRASMTGLMVYSTLHANDSTGAVTTLRNFNLPSHLIANSIQGVIAQRLLRRICAYCKVPAEVNANTAGLLGLETLPPGFAAWRGAGCERCLGTGYYGRIGVFEIFRVDPKVRDMILENASERSLRDHCIAQGMATLQQDGLRKILDGVTTIEEFRRILKF